MITKSANEPQERVVIPLINKGSLRSLDPIPRASGNFGMSLDTQGSVDPTPKETPSVVVSKLVRKAHCTRRIKYSLLDNVIRKTGVLHVILVVSLLVFEELVPIAHQLSCAKLRPSWSARNVTSRACEMTTRGFGVISNTIYCNKNRRERIQSSRTLKDESA